VTRPDPGAGAEQGTGRGQDSRPEREQEPTEGPPAAFYLHPAASLHDTGWNHPEHQGRLRSLASTVGKDMMALFGRVEQSEPPLAPEGALERVHTEAYLATLRDASAEAEASGSLRELDPETRISGASWEAVLGSSGAVCHAIDEILAGHRANAFVAARPPGHHALADRGMGFCLVNHVAVGARHALATGAGIGKVAIVDWDLHHGNGTDAIFTADPDVFYLSLHEWPQFPGTGASTERGIGAGEGTTLNVPLPAGTGYSTYRRVFVEGLERMFDAFSPDLILVSAGYDTLRADPLGSFELEPSHFHELTRLLVERAPHPDRIVAVLEGGYAPRPTGEAVVATLRALAGIPLEDPGGR
jgi:acetoin utilization deacetylase AcuC-like enzyme